MRHLAIFATCAVLTSCASQVNPHETPSSQQGSGMVYLSDTDPAYRELERLQEVAYSQHGALPKLTWASDSAELAFGVAERLGWDVQVLCGVIDSIREIGTHYEDVSTWLLLTFVFERVAEAALQQGYANPPPRRGTLPFPAANAAALHLHKSGEKVIVFNYQLFMVVNELAKLAVAPIPFDDKGDVLTADMSVDGFARSITEDPKLLPLFADRVLEFLGVTGPGDINPPDLIRHPLQMRLVQGAEEFIMAHEYAHVLLGHKGQLVPFLYDHSAPPSTQEEWTAEHEQDADDLGWTLFMSMKTPDDPYDRVRLWGAPFALSLLSVLEEARIALSAPDEPPNHVATTHPPTKDRLRRLMQRLDSVEARTDFDVAADASALTAIRNIHFLWGLTSEAFERLYNVGFRLSRSKRSDQWSFSDWFVSGYLAWTNREYAESVSFLEKALTCKRTSSDVPLFWTYFTLGYSLSEVGRLPEAVEALTLALQEDATYSWTYHNRGWALEKTGNRDAALLDYDRAVGLDGTEVRHLWHRARLQLLRNKPTAAEKDLDMISSLKAVGPETLLDVAEAYLIIQSWGKARSVLGNIRPQDAAQRTMMEFLELVARQASGEPIDELALRFQSSAATAADTLKWNFDMLKAACAEWSVSPTVREQVLQWVGHLENAQKHE